MKRMEQLEHLLNVFGNTEEVLNNVVQALSDDEFNEVYQHIKRCWDIEEDSNEQDVV